MKKKLENIFIKIFGVIFNGNCAVYDRYIWLKNNLIILNDNCKVLDIGCGNGWALFLARKKGYGTYIFKEIVGLSNEDHALKKIEYREKIIFGQNYINLINSNIKNLTENFKDKKFEIVINLENIEHVIDDEKLINDISNVIKPGGLLYLTTPNLFYKELYKDEIIKNVKIEDGGHVVRGYTFSNIKDLLKKYDFQIVKEEYLTGPLSIRLYSFQRFFLNKYVNLFLIPLIVIFNFIDRIFFPNYNNSHSIAVIAQKKYIRK